MRSFGLARLSLALPLLAAPALVSAQAAKAAPKLNQYGNPAKVAPAPTSAGISIRDLQIRLYQFADDSMQGRETGTIGNMKGTDYIAAEAKRLGMIPAGDDGTYFQVLPYHIRRYTPHSRVSVDGNPIAWNVDVVAIPGVRAPKPIAAAEVIFGGTAGDPTKQISAAQAAGKFVVLLPAVGSSGVAGAPGAGCGRGGGAPAPSRFPDAVAVATVDLDRLTPAQRVRLNNPRCAALSAGGGRGGRGGGANDAPIDSLALLKAQLAALQPQPVLSITNAAAARLFARTNIDGLAVGAKGGVVNASLDFVDELSQFGRNVVAIIPGSDPVLKNQFVAIGGHNDHDGLTAAPADKDSIKAFNDQRIRWQIANDMKQPDITVMSKFKVNMDSIRKLYPKPRLDSINNGADDDGSGSMAVLEIAEAIAGMKVKPKRSTLFVWHTGEEKGLLGSAFFTTNPTVPLDSVVTQINIDMIGRGRAADIPGGGDDYVGVIGSFFDSKDLGETVKKVNTKQSRPLTLDYKFDDPISWNGYNNIYGRSDHFNYAKAGVPIAFFFTGLHGDYHQRSDEAEYIDYPHYAKITNYIKDIVIEVSNGPRPQLNGTKPAKPKPIG